MLADSVPSIKFAECLSKICYTTTKAGCCSLVAVNASLSRYLILYLYFSGGKISLDTIMTSEKEHTESNQKSLRLGRMRCAKCGTQLFLTQPFTYRRLSYNFFCLRCYDQLKRKGDIPQETVEEPEITPPQSAKQEASEVPKWTTLCVQFWSMPANVQAHLLFVRLLMRWPTILIYPAKQETS